MHTKIPIIPGNNNVTINIYLVTRHTKAVFIAVKNKPYSYCTFISIRGSNLLIATVIKNSASKKFI